MPQATQLRNCSTQATGSTLPNPCALLRGWWGGGIRIQKLPENPQAKLGTVYKPKVALLRGRREAGYTKTHMLT